MDVSMDIQGKNIYFYFILLKRHHPNLFVDLNKSPETIKNIAKPFAVETAEPIKLLPTIEEPVSSNESVPEVSNVGKQTTNGHTSNGVRHEQESDILVQEPPNVPFIVDAAAMGKDDWHDHHYRADYNFFGSIQDIVERGWNRHSHHYVKGCKWSPDGACLLTAVNNDGMHIVELNTEFYGKDCISAKRDVQYMDSVVHVSERGDIYDYCWYPFMNSYRADTCL